MPITQNNKTSQERKSIRHQYYDYSRNGYYFVTICTYEKKHLFGEIINERMKRNELGNVVQNLWDTLETETIKPSNKIVMPNHFHGIIRIQSELYDNQIISNGHNLIERRKMLLPKVIGKFKMITAKQINQILNRKGAPVWQRNYHDHIIRDDREYYNILEYIEKNPESWKKDKYF